MPRRLGPTPSLNVRLFTCLVLLMILDSGTVQAQAPPPPLSDSLVNTPGPSGGARLGDFYYVYARNPSTNQVQVRKTNGVPTEGSGTSWTALPSLATDCYPTAAPVCTNTTVPVAQKISVIARRMSDGQLMVTQTTTGNSGFAAWKVIPGGTPGTKTDTSPSAIWFRPTLKTGVVDTTIGGVVVYYSNLLDGSVYYIYSSDGYNTWSAPQVMPFGNIASGPTAVVDVDPYNSSWLYMTRIEYKANDVSTLPGFNRQRIFTDYDLLNGTMGVGFTDYPMKSPANRKDPAIVAKVGSCINEKDPTSWAGFHIPEVTTMRASVMKFHLTFNNSWGGTSRPTWSDIDYSQLKDCVTAGAKTIILRTAETPLDAGQMNHFMGTMKFQDQPSKSVSSLAGDQAFAGVRLIIENGNEPDHVYPPLDPILARDKALSGITVKSSYPSFKFIVSMPIDNGSAHLFTYSKQFVSPNSSGKKVLEEYDGAACHAYTEANLNWNNTGEEPLGALYFTLARLPYAKFIHMTEVGLNSRTVLWGAKGLSFINAMYAAPSCVEGWEIFCTSVHPEWNTFTHYCMDKNYTDVQVTQVRPTTVAPTQADLDFTKITFNSTASYPIGTTIAYKNIWLNNPPFLNPLLFEGKTQLPAIPAPMPPAGAGACWVRQWTQGTNGVNLSAGQGWIDRYPLTTTSGRPGATAIGNR